MTILECPSTIPAAPSGAVTTWNSETKVNTVVSYKCSGKLFTWLQCTENVVSLAYIYRICI